MEQHAIPRQITTFEFKLIGFLTIKQFVYLIIFFLLGIMVFFIFPIPYVNLFLALIPVLLGIALAFFPIYDKSLDQWLILLYKRLTSPTQYFFKKEETPIYFLKDLTLSPNLYINHYLQSTELLNSYLAKNQIFPSNEITQKKQQINQLFFLSPSKKSSKSTINQKTDQIAKSPFLSGWVKNYKLVPLPGILVYIKKTDQTPVRILKTNPHGIFATLNPLPNGEYLIEPKDPKGLYLFDTIKINVTQKNQPITIISRNLI